MPTIACPGCGRQYKLPANAAGQVAKCACGKRFKLGAPSPAPTSARSSTSSTAAVVRQSTPQAPLKSQPANRASNPKPAASQSSAKTSSLETDDDFWNEGLKKAAPSPQPSGNPTHSTGSMIPSPTGRVAAIPAPKKRKKNSENRFHWGLDLGKVAGGLLTFVVAGGFFLLLLTTANRIHPYSAIIAVMGLFTALSGLMGD